mmetsp:Transcript_50876/g.87151  ORF Transcript_50876/g.87151 Transcript_50876/m.87151 type:complete len:214 (+) Transcript_50876:138-779(+)
MVECFVFSLGPAGLWSPLSVLFRLEPHVSFTLRRHFDFNRSILFFDDLRHVPSAVLVSKGDSLMPSDSILAIAEQEEDYVLVSKGNAPSARAASPATKGGGTSGDYTERNGGGGMALKRRSGRIASSSSVKGGQARDNDNGGDDNQNVADNDADLSIRRVGGCLTVEAFPPIRGEHCDHGTWCHDGPMNRIVFERIQEVSQKIASADASPKNK